MIKYSRINVVDIEATCGEEVDRLGDNEIIEIGITQIDIPKQVIIKSDHVYCRNVISPITPFCTQLTGISQELLNKEGMPFVDACEWMIKNFETYKYGWAAMGNYDMWMFHNQCRKFGLAYPFSKSYINISMLYALLTHRAKGVGLKKMCELMNIEMEGRHHSGKDDAYNTAKLLLKLTKLGYVDFNDLGK